MPWRRRALTLLELLIVVAVISLVIALLLPTWGHGTPVRALITRCGSTLRTQSMAFSLASTQNAGVWPVSTASLSNLCQQTTQTRDQFCSSGAIGSSASIPVSKYFYCPGTRGQDPAVLWTQPGDVSTWGYVWLNDRGSSGAALPATFSPRTPPLQYLSTLNVKTRAWDTVIAADVVVTDTLTAPYNYSPKTATIPFGTNTHGSASSSYVNVLFADGHVSAVKFDPAKATPIPQNGGGIFWIPTPP